METPACLPRCDGGTEVGRRGHDAARQRRRSRRAARGTRDRISRAGHRTEDHAPARSRPGEHHQSRGLADRQSAARCAASAISPSQRPWHWCRASPRRPPRRRRNGCWRENPESSRTSRRTWKRSYTWCATRRSCWVNRATFRRTTRWSMNSARGRRRRKSTRCSRRSRRRLPGLIREVLVRQDAQPILPITGKFSAARQRALAVEIMKAVGFPFDRGRLDESEHPFTEGVPGDVRVTTRFDPNRTVLGSAGRAARNRPRHVRRGPACRNSPTSRWAATAAWRWRKASRCSWK